MILFKIPGINEGLVVPVEEIVRVEAVSNYSRIHFANGKKITVAKVLHWFEDTLPVEMFARVHRSHLVNKIFVEKVRGTHSRTLLLNNGESIIISRRKRMLFNAASLSGEE